MVKAKDLPQKTQAEKVRDKRNKQRREKYKEKKLQSGLYFLIAYLELLDELPTPIYI